MLRTTLWKSKGGLLLTEEKYSEFELHLDFKHDWGSDSAVFLRTNDQAAGM
ncbi:MAG: DUF1080 domain-containing protein [Lentisphaerales bacterium]|nr:DUF1080 domain-containing protein [Lentisphaerales bacterium]